MWITADNSMDQDDVGIIRIEQDGNGIEAGIYQFSVFAPDADGGEIQQNFTLIVTDDSAAKTATTVTVTVPDVCFGDALQPNIEVKAGDTVIPGCRGGVLHQRLESGTEPTGRPNVL